MDFRLAATAAALQAAFPRRHADPRDLIERLPTGDITSLHIAHIDTLLQMAGPHATAQTLWDWTSNVLTWSRAAELMGLDEAAMGFQLRLCADLVERWKRTGRVGFDGPGFVLAKHGVDVMDEIARMVPVHVAREAALWSEEQLARMRADELQG
jgi:hypothetical protein